MEACIIMGILAPKAGRGIVRALKALLGPWCLAQADSHSDTAKNAGAAFRETFPGPKAREAVALFRNQVCCCSTVPRLLAGRLMRAARDRQSSAALFGRCRSAQASKARPSQYKCDYDAGHGFSGGEPHSHAGGPGGHAQGDARGARRAPRARAGVLPGGHAQPPGLSAAKRGFCTQGYVYLVL